MVVEGGFWSQLPQSLVMVGCDGLPIAKMLSVYLWQGAHKEAVTSYACVKIFAYSAFQFLKNNVEFT